MMKVFELIARRRLLVLSLILLPFLFSCRTPPPLIDPIEEDIAEEYAAEITDTDLYEDYLAEEVPMEEILEEPEIPELIPDLEPEPPEPIAEEAPEPEPVPDLIMEPEPELAQEPPVPEPEPMPDPEPIEPPLLEPEPPLALPPLPEPEPVPPAPEPEPEPPPVSPLALPPPPPPFFGPPEPVAPPPAEPPPPVTMLPEFPGRPLPEPAPVIEEDIAFSRIVRITVGQILEIPFRGTGWVFLGELDNRPGLPYDSRRLDSAAGSVIGQSFIFRAETAGTYTLRFFRQDFIQDYVINDHVQVIVEEAANIPATGSAFFPADRDRVIAEPRWPPLPGEQWLPPSLPLAPDAALVTEGAAALPPLAPEPAFGAEDLAGEAMAALPAIPPPLPLADSPADYVRRARAEFDAGRVAPALAILDEMRLRFPAGSDEAWLLYAQLFEANSPSRDIQQSLEFYRRLVSEYPHSNLVAEALRRIAHLERFFFNIR